MNMIFRTQDSLITASSIRYIDTENKAYYIQALTLYGWINISKVGNKNEAIKALENIQKKIELENKDILIDFSIINTDNVPCFKIGNQ